VHGIEALEHKHLLDAERRTREQAQKSLTEALSASVSAMVTAMEMRDPYTAGHENRTADIAYAIGKEMGWPEGRLQGLRMAAMVHDIGKISIPSELLNKPSRLSQEEFELVKGHPESSYAILKDIPFTWPIAEIVRQHHEKLDGSGYPQGLKGDEILPEAKVLTVADIVEAMAAARPYRRGLGLEIALAEIERQAGTLLDAEVVEICTRLFREGRLIIPGLQLG
jgi:HD-GYP domain-containing protein (c-di-GMP phosphodiesterase class II)